MKKTQDVKVPSLGESIVEATVARWLKSEGDWVQEDEPLVELETDKVTLEVGAPLTGILSSVLHTQGESVKIGDVLGGVTEGQPPEIPSSESHPLPAPTPVLGIPSSSSQEDRRIRVPMTHLRQLIAERLKKAQSTAAILTTFNEVDMSRILETRTQLKDTFARKHGLKLGIMSFFVKACTIGLKEIPSLNATIEENDIIYNTYYDIGVAVGTPQGLVVPIVRDADTKSFAQIEQDIASLKKKAHDNTLSLEDLKGGTFTISNGGVYGSLMSTPILNPPQSAILGMHKIQERPVAIEGKISIRPMMYLALSYDHRLIDGQEAVTFLLRVKECLETPERVLLGV